VCVCVCIIHTQTHTQGGANTHTHTHTHTRWHEYIRTHTHTHTIHTHTHTRWREYTHTHTHTHKVALGLRAGQSHEQEKIDLQSRNWHKFSKLPHILKLLSTSARAQTHLRFCFVRRRMMRMHRANLRFPEYREGFQVTVIAQHRFRGQGLGGL
jgi:hypothetical protein